MRRLCALLVLAGCGGGGERLPADGAPADAPVVVPPDAAGEPDAPSGEPDAAPRAIDAAPPDAPEPPDAPLPIDAPPPPPDAPEPPPVDAPPPIDAPPPPPPDAMRSITVDVVEPSIALGRGQSGTLAVALSRFGSGLPGVPIDLAVTGAPLGVSWSFSPDPAPLESSTLTLEIGALAPLGQVTLTVTGSAPGSGMASDTFVLDVTSHPVAGLVLDENHEVLRSARVSIGGATVFTASDGTFKLDDAPRPYDVVLVSSDEKHVTRWEGLTRDDPTLYMMATAAQPAHGGIMATYPGGDGNPSTGAFSSRDTEVHGSAHNGELGVVLGSFYWRETEAVDGTFRVLKYTTVNDGTVPVNYTSYAAASGVNMNQGQTTSGVTLDFGPVATQDTLAGTLVSGAPTVEVAVYSRWSDGAAMRLGDTNVKERKFSAVVPVLPGAKLWVVATAIGDGGGVGAVFSGPYPPGSADLALPIAAPPDYVAPPDLAAGVTAATPFSWTSWDGVFVLSTPATATPTYAVVTRATRATLPMDAVAPPRNRAYKWQVRAFGPFASIDEAAVEESDLLDLPLRDSNVTPRAGRAFARTATVQRGFTTAP